MTIRDQIIHLLSSHICGKLSFHFATISIHGWQYRKVAHNIANGHIQIVQVAGMGPDKAEYRVDRNTMLVGPMVAADLIVHEATHAIEDMVGRHQDRYDAEAAAYVAQAMYLMLKKPSLRGTPYRQNVQFAKEETMACVLNASKCNSAIANAAAVIAGCVLEKRRPHPGDLRRLREAIYNTSSYYAPGIYPPFDGLKKNNFLSTVELANIHGTLVH